MIRFPFLPFQIRFCFKLRTYSLWSFAFWRLLFWMEFRVNISCCLCSWLKTFPNLPSSFAHYQVCFFVFCFSRMRPACILFCIWITLGSESQKSDICIGISAFWFSVYFLSYWISSVLDHIFALSPIRATLFFDKIIIQNFESFLPVHWYHLFVFIRYHKFFHFSIWNIV